MSVLLITHDLGLVAESCDFASVMYAGKVVEHGPTAEILRNPKHPYTAGLLASTPRGDGGSRLQEIPGVVPDLRSLPPGCRFRDRCPKARPECASEPPVVTVGPRNHRCLFPLGDSP
jgi:oligopeptide/dipeptide ABC transporter ATP-binding protein